MGSFSPNSKSLGEQMIRLACVTCHVLAQPAVVMETGSCGTNMAIRTSCCELRKGGRESSPSTRNFWAILKDYYEKYAIHIWSPCWAQGLSSKTRSWNRRQHGRVWLTLKMLELSAGTGTGLSINDTKPASPFVYALIPRDEGEKGTFLNLPEGQALHGCQCRRGWKPSSHRPRSVAPPCCNFSLMLFTRSSY